MVKLINSISSSADHFIQDCKELKNYSHMERGEFARRVTSIMLRALTATTIAVGVYGFTEFPLTCTEYTKEVADCCVENPSLFKAIVIGIGGLTITTSTAIASLILLKLNSMIAPKPVCKPAHLHQ